MRTFITLEFDEKTKENIAGIQNLIRQKSIKGRFKYIDNFHLTLKFLGETTDAQINIIYKELLLKLVNQREFCINLCGIGCFGPGKIIKTIYIKADGDVNILSEVARKADEAASKAGFELDNKYTPHITIAQDVALCVPFEELRKELEEKISYKVTFDKVTIMKSEQIGYKRIYTPIKIISLDKVY